MTAVQWLEKILEGQKDKPFNYLEWKIAFQHALEMEKEQIMQIVLNLLYHELGHDDTARWIAERLEAGIINLNDL